MLYEFNNKKLLIFDFDGTLSNTSMIHKKSFIEALSHFNLKAHIDYDEIAGMSTKDSFTVIADNNPALKSVILENIDDLISLKKMNATRYIGTSAKPFPGVVNFLEWAKSKNYLLTIASSGSRANVLPFLKKFGLNSFFLIIKCSEDCIYTKPNPELFLTILEELKIEAKNAFIFEDSISGAKAAELAGINYALVDPNYWINLRLQ